jgi:hypothetical protein
MKAALRRWLFPIAYFTGLSVVMTWPLVPNMVDSVALQLGDNLEYIWLIGWFEESLLRLHESPFFVATLNYPEGWSPAYTEVPTSMVLPVLPISAVAGPVAAYNASVIVSFVLSGLIVYAWVKRVSGDTLAAVLAGSIFAFSPYRYSHFLAGHLNLLGTHWVALYFLGLVGLLIDRGRSKVYPLLAGLGLGLIAFTSQYYLYMSLVLTSVVLVVRFFWVSRWEPADSGIFYRLGLLALVGLPLVVVSLVPYFQLDAVGDLPARSVEYVRQYSASPTDFVLPATTSILWGRWVGETFERSYWIEATLYLGIVATGLAVVGVLRSTSPRWLRGSVYLILAFTLSAIFLSLGTDLHWLSQPVFVDVPSFLQKWVAHSPVHLPLPGRALFEWAPYYDRMRVWMRYGVFALLGLSVLAGYGAAWISRSPHRWRRSAVSIGLLAAVLLDFAPRPQRFVEVQPRPVDEWLASQTEPGALVEFPFEKVADQAQLYYTLTHQKPFLGGSFNAFPPPQFQRIKPVLDLFPNRSSVDLLLRLGVRYVLVHSEEYANYEEIDRRIRGLGLHWEASYNGIHAYVLEGADLAP